MLTFEFILPDVLKDMTLANLLEFEWFIPKKIRHFLRMDKGISRNGKTLAFHEIVHGGDLLHIAISSKYFQFPKTVPEPGEVEILFEDEHLLVVDKPAGIKTHPNAANETGTLANLVAFHLGYAPFIVHRLDTETSGIILFAKHPFVVPSLGYLLEHKKIFRRYIAKVAVTNRSIPSEGTISKAIGRDRHDKRKRVISQNGQAAITHYHFLKKLNERESLIICQLETGRTHQIRVHLADLGCPIVGDPLYGEASKDDRMYLHAYEMVFQHPFSKITKTFTCKPDKSFDV